ncbi:MAG: CHASE3 domain-containing protein [Nitrospirae bacterium]|nr:CHASE3 domain-containing protein [Nitrospirota bacterium]
MGSTKKVEKTVSIGFLLSLVIFGLISINSYRNIDHFVVDNERVTHTYMVIEKLEEVLSLLKDAETGQRGFIITGKSSYLEPYQKGIVEVKDRIEELRRLTADNRAHRKLMEDLEHLVSLKFLELRETIDLRSRVGFAASVRVIETHRGKRIMDSIRKIISEMKTTEAAFLAQKLRESSQSAGVALGTLILGNVLAFIILVVSIALLFRQIAERKKAEDVLRGMNENLAERVEERTAELRKTNEALMAETNSRKQIEDELVRVQKFESLGVLAGGIAHDFNNLLAVISGNANLGLMQTDENHKAYQRLREVEKATQRAADLTRQLLTFSKAGAPVKHKANIESLVRETAGLALSGAATSYNLSVPQALPDIEIDAGQISQVIHNMVINADHAMPGGGNIDLKCEMVSVNNSAGLPLREGDYVRISIRDRGIGIPGEHLAKIFDPYFTTKQKGSGLGLATSYSIVTKHGGHIHVESETGKGTLFQIYLPEGP